MTILQLTEHPTPYEDTIGASGGRIDLTAGIIRFEDWTGTDESSPVQWPNYVEYDGEMPVVYPSSMVVGQLYIFTVYGLPVCALKEEDNSVTIFYIPSAEYIHGSRAG